MQLTVLLVLLQEQLRQLPEPMRQVLPHLGRPVQPGWPELQQEQTPQEPELPGQPRQELERLAMKVRTAKPERLGQMKVRQPVPRLVPRPEPEPQPWEQPLELLPLVLHLGKRRGAF